jgi:CD2 antigen cytoplasmic tail-binding protein 2
VAEQVIVSQMLSSFQKSNGRKAVRFAETTAAAAAPSDETPVNGNHHDEHPLEEQEEDALLQRRNPKRKRRDRPNEDELDDIDEYDETEDDDDDNLDHNNRIPSHHDLLQAKQKRRMVRQVGNSGLQDAGEEDEDADPQQATRIDNRTSLAAEGIEIEPFSMDNDRNDGMGYFEGDTFVFRKRGVDDEPDAWVEGLDNNIDEDDYDDDDEVHGNDHKYIRKSSTSKFIVKNGDNHNNTNNEQQDRLDDWTEDDLYAKILPNLAHDNESVLQAIVRYGNVMKLSKQNKADQSNNNSRQLAQDSLNDLTEAANALLLKGKINIYQQAKMDIAKLVPLPTTTNNNDNNTPPEVQWEYRGNEDGKIHGLYSTQEMMAWIGAGYFVGPSAVQVRTVSQGKSNSANDKTKSIQDDLMSDLLEDENDDDITDKQESTVHGDWMLSDTVDFAKYLV